MKILYLRTLMLLLCGVGINITDVDAQPDGNYGIEAVKYAVPSGAYFASATGTGGAPCSQSTPCSLSKALSSAPSGTTIVLRGGTYRTSDYDAKIPRKLTLQPYPGETVTLKGSKIASDWKSDGGAWRTSWSTLFPAKYVRDSTNTVTTENLMAAHQDMVFINGKALRQVGSMSEVKSGTFYVDYASKQVYVGSDPSGKTVEITASTWGLHTYGVSVSGIRVRGLKFTHYAECGMMLQSPDAVIENNEFTENALAGMKIYSGKRAIIRHNRFSYNGLQGAGINHADGLLFENNIVEGNNSEKHNRISWSAAGIKVLESASCMIRNNLFRNNDANGIWLDHRADETFIINNRVENEARNGIHCEISNRVVIAANVVTGCGYNPEATASGIEVLNSADVGVYNNTIVENNLNLSFRDEVRPLELMQNETGSRNAIVKNNLLSDAAIREYPSCQLWAKRRNCSQNVIKELDHNGYHKSSLTQPDLLVRWKVTSTCNDEEKIESLAELRDKLSHGHNSIALTGTDPFFIDRSAGDFRLKSGSPAIKAGTALPADILAALGWNSAPSMDMGAFQSPYASAPALITGIVPWSEGFELFNGTYEDDGINDGSAWSLDKRNVGANAVFEVYNSKLMARGTVKEGAWQSEVIQLNGQTVNLSMVLTSQGALESSHDYDYVRVYYSIDQGSEQLIEEVKGNISGYKVVSAKAITGNSLQIIVRFKNSELTEYYFLDDVHVEPVNVAPATPVGLITSNITCTGFEATWNPVNSADKYTIQLYSDGALSRLVSAQTIVGNTARFNSLAPGTTYYLQVKAENVFGSSSFSAKADVTTASVPAAPTNIQATNIQFSQFDAIWHAASQAEAYIVEVIVAGGDFAKPDFSQTVTTTTATFTGLAEGTLYQFRVRSKNSCGEGKNVTSAVFSTHALPVDYESLELTVCESTIGSKTTIANLKEIGSLIDGGAGKQINWYEDMSLSVAVTDPNNVSVSDGHIFYAQIRKEDAITVVAVTFKVNEYPTDVTNVQAQYIGLKSFDAIWHAASQAEAYIVEVIVAGGDFAKPDFSQTVTTTTATFTGLAEGTSYQFRVRGKNSCGEGKNVTSDVFTTSGNSAPPPTVGNLPWLEDFNGSSYKGSTETSQMHKHGSFKVENGWLTARGTGEVSWHSEVIQLNGETVNLSMVLTSQGALESSHDYDYVRVYYRLDQGSEKLIEEVKGNISGYKVVSAKAITGNSLQIIVRFKNSDITEHYRLDRVLVEKTSSPAPPTAGNLPWVEEFSSSATKGKLLTDQLYKNAIFKVESGKLLARGVGKAAWQSETIRLNGETVKLSVQVSSKGSLETASDHVRLYYRVDNGSEKLAGEVRGNISGTRTLSLSGVKGNSLQLIIRINNSDITEHYYVDNLRVEATGSSARVDESGQMDETDVKSQIGTDKIKEETINVYPNPFTSFVRVKINSEETKGLSLTVLDMNGRKVYEENQLKTNEVITLDLSNLKKGIYLLKVIDEEGRIQTQRIVK